MLFQQLIVAMSNGENYDELNQYENSLSVDEKKDIIKLSMPRYVKTVYPDDTDAINCTSFEEALPILYKNSAIGSATEESFWASIADINVYFDQQILGFLYFEEDGEKMRLSGYTVENPNNETSSEYTATTSGTYSFTVTDKVTGESCKKEVTVNI